MEVHPTYLAALESGSPPEQSLQGVGWDKPKVSRSRWFDLFSSDDRYEAMEMLWRLTSYLARVRADH